jgi:glycerol-3-phosphate dehydrogenase
VSTLQRRPDVASRSDYDLIIVGGGIHGACMALEAARRGLRPALIEKNDFGGATSASSLRILHGGLRYLQTADLARIRTSIRERRWFCRNFPDLVRPLACLMPLYGGGLRRPAVMRSALALNDLLSARRNHGVHESVHLPRGQVLSPQGTAAAFSGVRRAGLLGGALWYDAVMTSSERVVLEILRWAADLGAVALNYVEAAALRTDAGGIRGVEAIDHATGSSLLFRAPVAVNCAGPWTPDIADAFGQPAEHLFTRALAFNLLLDRTPVSDAALALDPGDGGGMVFLVPWNGRILAGTHHAPWSGYGEDPVADAVHIADMITRLNRALPALALERRDVLRIMAGFMPATTAGEGTPASRAVIVDHAGRGGARGLYSVVGVKFTTARAVAERALHQIFGARPIRPKTARNIRSGMDIQPDVHAPPAAWRTIIEEEAVMHLDDLLLRRTEWEPGSPVPVAALAALAGSLNWDPARQQQELKRFDRARRLRLEAV